MTMKTIIKSELRKMGLKIKSVKLLNKGGSSNEKFLVKTESEMYILKTFCIIKNKVMKIRDLQHQMDLMQKINEKEIVSIFPVHTKVLVFNCIYKIGYVYKFVKGEPLSKLLSSTPNQVDSFKIGKSIGKFHKYSKNLFKSKYKKITWKRRLFNITRQLKGSNFLKSHDCFSLLNNFISKTNPKSFTFLIRKYFSEYTNTRTQIIHTDLHEENIIVTPTGNLILVDVDGLQGGHTSQDIAGYLIPTHKLLDLSEIDDTIQYDKFLSGYKSEFKLTKNEVKIIPLWMLVRLLTNFEYIIDEIGKIPTSDTRKKIYKCSSILEHIRGIATQILEN